MDPIITTVSLEKRAEQAGLEIVLEQENIPKPTQGRVIALGEDPLLRESVKLGEIVFFHAYAGHDVVLEEKTYRQLLISDITGVMDDSDLNPTEPESSSKS